MAESYRHIEIDGWIRVIPWPVLFVILGPFLMLLFALTVARCVYHFRSID